MSYLTVISLERAKDYLRIDQSNSDDNLEITSMIKGALRYIERRTNHILYPRVITYNGSCQVKVYDYPINSIVTLPLPLVVYYSTFAVYPDVKDVTLNVGYAIDTVPDDLIQCALQMIKVFYYESEKQVNSTLIPESVKEVLNTYNRFI